MKGKGPDDGLRVAGFGKWVRSKWIRGRQVVYRFLGLRLRPSIWYHLGRSYRCRMSWGSLLGGGGGTAARRHGGTAARPHGGTARHGTARHGRSGRNSDSGVVSCSHFGLSLDVVSWHSGSSGPGLMERSCESPHYVRRFVESACWSPQSLLAGTQLLPRVFFLRPEGPRLYRRVFGRPPRSSSRAGTPLSDGVTDSWV